MDSTDAERDILALSNQLCFSVYATANAFSRLYTELLDSLDVTYTQYLVLLVLWEREGLTIREIAQRLTLDSGTLTPLLQRLEKAGYVWRVRSQQDQRRVQVYLTDKAHGARPQVERIRKVVGKATGLSQTELSELQSNLEAVRQALDRATGTPEEAADSSETPAASRTATG